MSEQLEAKGTIVLANPQPQIKDKQSFPTDKQSFPTDKQEYPISASEKPVSLRRFKVSRSIVPVDKSESSDWTIAGRLAEKMRTIEEMESSIVNRALEGNINHHPTQQFEIEQEIPEGQENLIGDVITVEDGSILSFKEIKKQNNLLPGQVEQSSGLIPLTSLENQGPKTIRVVDVGIVSAKKVPMLDNTELKRAA